MGCSKQLESVFQVAILHFCTSKRLLNFFTWFHFSKWQTHTHTHSDIHAFIEESPRVPSGQWETKKSLLSMGMKFFFFPVLSLWEFFLLILPSRKKRYICWSNVNSVLQLFLTHWDYLNDHRVQHDVHLEWGLNVFFLLYSAGHVFLTPFPKPSSKTEPRQHSTPQRQLKQRRITPPTDYKWKCRRHDPGAWVRDSCELIWFLRQLKPIGWEQRLGVLW